jgi:hypothetical protein
MQVVQLLQNSSTPNGTDNTNIDARSTLDIRAESKQMRQAILAKPRYKNIDGYLVDNRYFFNFVKEWPYWSAVLVLWALTCTH